MLKESFLFRPSYKAQLRFFCGTNIEEDVEDVAFPVFAGSVYQDHSGRGLTHIIFILQFQETISGTQKYALGAIEYSSPVPYKSKCEAKKS